MKSVNKVILLGNVTRDPELKSIKTGQSVCTFSLATNREWKDPKGELKQATEFHNIVAWGPLAGVCGKYIKKGSPLYIEGHLKTDSWEGTDKKKHVRTEVVVDDVVFLGMREEVEAGKVAVGV